jgi:lysozyme family protein
MTFAACIPIILESEGGYVNDPRDPGQATNLGITRAVLSEWQGHPASIDEVKHLTRETASRIYQINYYGPVHGPELSAGLDLMVFDAAVNHGVGRAIRFLQRAAHVADDGHFGPITLAAVLAAPAADLINAYHDAREAFYRSLPTFGHFGKGWIARNDRTRTLALAMVT